MKKLMIVLSLLFISAIIISCSNKPDYEIIKDYNKKIHSIEEAKEIFKEIYYEKIGNLSDNVQIKENIDLALSNIRLTKDKDYIFQWGGFCQILYQDGKLSVSYYCGPY